MYFKNNIFQSEDTIFNSKDFIKIPTKGKFESDFVDITKFYDFKKTNNDIKFTIDYLALIPAINDQFFQRKEIDIDGFSKKIFYNIGSKVIYLNNNDPFSIRRSPLTFSFLP